jgi:hypothetical protein
MNNKVLVCCPTQTRFLHGYTFLPKRILTILLYRVTKKSSINVLVVL